MTEFQQLVLQILGIGAIGALLQNNLFYQLLLKWLRLEVKPFNCALCLTFWVATPIFIEQEPSIFQGFTYGVMTAIIAELLDRKLQI